VLLVFGAPCQLRLLAGQEHGRTIPLADIQVPACLISAALQTYRTNVSGLPHCKRIRTFMLAA